MLGLRGDPRFPQLGSEDVDLTAAIFCSILEANDPAVTARVFDCATEETLPEFLFLQLPSPRSEADGLEKRK